MPLESGPSSHSREIGNLLTNNQRQRRTCYTVCHILYPVPAAHMSIVRMDSNSLPLDTVIRARLGTESSRMPMLAVDVAPWRQPRGKS